MNVINEAAYDDYKKKKKQQDTAAITTAAGYAGAGQNAWQKKADNMAYELGYTSNAQAEAPKAQSGEKVRDYLIAAGLDNSQIGYADGKVTYKNKSMTPTANENGVTYAPKQTLDSFISDIYADSGKIGIRKTISDLGLDTNKLGWSNGKVTYNGIEYEPPVNANGVTYGNKQDVMNFAGKALASEGDGLVQINSYRPASGIYDVGWNDATKKVLIGGEEVPYVYIDESGNAWGKKSDVEAAYKQAADRLGIKDTKSIYDAWQEKADKLDSEYEDEKSDSFFFGQDELEAMPEYQAYKAMYEREGDRARRDTLAGGTARTGGNMSSMARSQANQAYDYYMEKLNDIIPQMAEIAYQRYKDGKDRTMNIIDKQNELYQTGLQNESGLSQQAYENLLESQKAQRERVTNAREDKEAEMNFDMQEAENAAAISGTYNTPIPQKIADKYGIAPNSDGTYPTINQLTIDMKNEIWEKYDKGVYTEEQAIALENELATMAAEFEYEMALAQGKSDISVAAAAQKAAISAKNKKTTSAKKTSTNTSGSKTSGTLSQEEILKALKGK